MPFGPKPDNPPPYYFGWAMLGIACLGTIATSPGQSFLIGIFNPYFTDTLGLSNSRLAFAYMLATIAASIPLSLVGKLSDRYGTRLAMGSVVVALSLACVYMGFVQGFWSLLIGFFMLRFFGQGALGLISGHTVALWFERRLGTMESVRHLSMHAAVMILPVPVAGLILGIGWRTTYPLLGLIVALLTLPAIILVFRNKPEEAGQILDQHLPSDQSDKPAQPHQHEPAPESEQPVAPDDPAFTLRQAISTKAFWALAGVPVLNGLIGTALIFDMQGLIEASQITTDEGAMRTLGAAVMAPWGITSAVVGLAGGWLIDRVRPRYLLAASPPLLAAAVGMIWVGLAVGASWWFFAGMAVFGASQGLAIAASGPTVARWFGRKHHGAIRGLMSTLSVAGTACGPIVLGLSVDYAGGYTLGLIIFIVMAVPLTITVWTIDRPPAPDSPNSPPPAPPSQPPPQASAPAPATDPAPDPATSQDGQSDSTHHSHDQQSPPPRDEDTGPTPLP